MNNKRNILLALLAILALSREINASSPDTQPAIHPPSNTIVAARVLRLDSPNAEARAHAQNWAGNMQSDDLARMRWAAADTLGVTAQETSRALFFVFDSGELQVAVDLTNHGPDEKRPEYKMLASEAADHVVETLKQLINESRNAAQIDQMNQRCGELQAQRDNLRKQVDDQELMLRKANRIDRRLADDDPPASFFASNAAGDGANRSGGQAGAARCAGRTNRQIHLRNRGES